MPRTHTFHIARGEAGERLDRFLLSHLPKGCSRAQIQRWIASGEVTVDGRLAKPSLRLKTSQTLSLAPSNQPDIPPLAPEPIPLDVVYEDAQLLVINKQPGLVTHPAQGHWTGTLVQAVLYHLQEKGERIAISSQQSVLRLGPAGPRSALTLSEPFDSARDSGPRSGQVLSLSKHERSESKGSAISKSKHSQAIEARRPGIVHRLDKDTSGLLIVAKTEAAHRSLSKQLAARKIHRTYLAVVEGLVPRDEGTINAPIGRHLTHRKEFTVRAGGREAVTHYRVIKRASSTDLGLRTSPAPPRGGADLGRFSVLEVQLETGRTHQIRVHLAHIGHPVLGDAVYGRRCLSSVSRQLLHAKALALTHPVTGKALAFEAVLPADFQPFLD